MCRVMLVDDEPMLVEMYAEMLAVGGHDCVATASDGLEAVEKFEALLAPPDIILMDHRMPRKSGLAATQEITAAHPGTKVLIVTADHTVLPFVESGGACGYLQKPFSMSELFTTIDNITGTPQP